MSINRYHQAVIGVTPSVEVTLTSWQQVCMIASVPAGTATVPKKSENLYLEDTALSSKTSMVKLAFEKCEIFIAKAVTWGLPR